MARKASLDKLTRLMKEFKPRTQNQAEYIRTMSENEITICIGPPGSGKTMCSVGLACEYLTNNKVDELIFTRPILGCGKGLAALPGTVFEKIIPYFVPVIDCLEYFLGKDDYRLLFQNGTIKFIPLELMRGMSIKNTFLVLDEASNAELTQLKMLLTRLDKGSKFVLNGDYNQSDLKHCDFKDAVFKLKDKNIQGLGYCELTQEDIQRPKIIHSILSSLEE